MTEQDSTQVPKPDANDSPEKWKHYWAAVQPKEWFEAWGHWRTEPEISMKRQQELDERRKIVPDIEQGTYPFKGIKLSRADVEWLLVTHESGRGPVNWNDESQHERWGLDMRGADLSTINLTFLPLARLRAGLASEERPTRRNRIWSSMAAANLKGSNLFDAHLEGAILSWAHLEDATLEFAHLEMADFEAAHLEGATLRRAHLEGAFLRFAFFDAASNLNYAYVSNKQLGACSVGNTNWGSVNLTIIDWSQVNMLGDERRAGHKEMPDGKKKNDTRRLSEYRVAVRANRQLAVILQAQGLNEEATRFAYRAQKLQRIVFRRQRQFGKYLFSGFLDLLAGYGYRPLRGIGWYLATIFWFAWAYYHLEHPAKLHLSYVGAIIFSITAFHGRGFFLGGDFGYDSPVTILAALEAIIGLLIELSFIATFTQRFFGK